MSSSRGALEGIVVSTVPGAADAAADFGAALQLGGQPAPASLHRQCPHHQSVSRALTALTYQRVRAVAAQWMLRPPERAPSCASFPSRQQQFAAQLQKQQESSAAHESAGAPLHPTRPPASSLLASLLRIPPLRPAVQHASENGMLFSSHQSARLVRIATVHALGPALDARLRERDEAAQRLRGGLDDASGRSQRPMPPGSVSARNL